MIIKKNKNKNPLKVAQEEKCATWADILHCVSDEIDSK